MLAGTGFLNGTEGVVGILMTTATTILECGNSIINIGWHFRLLVLTSLVIILVTTGAFRFMRWEQPAHYLTVGFMTRFTGDTGIMSSRKEGRGMRVISRWLPPGRAMAGIAGTGGNKMASRLAFRR